MTSDSGDFAYDVFLSHSAKDKAVVRDVAERLRKDGVKVWFDEWVLKPGDSIPSKVEEGLVLCMSAARQTTLLPVKRPGVTDIEAQAAIKFTAYRRTLLQ